MFSRYVGIDYSGAATPESRLRGLRVYEASPETPAREVTPPGARPGQWSRREVAAWLHDALAAPAPLIVGLDHSFSFPSAYFEKYALPPRWDAFLDDFAAHWHTADRGVTVESVRRGLYGRGAARTGKATWRRLAEVRAGAKSVFHYDVPGSVAKSTHAGLPWLIAVRRAFGPRVHFWPYDGWMPPQGKSVVAEAYPSLHSQAFRKAKRTPDQHDAYAIAAWLRREDLAGRLREHFVPPLSPEEKAVAAYEGWILGV